MTVNRCIWANSSPLYTRYHDEEWGVPIRGDDQKLFEALVLEEMQVGLSRLMILQRRENLRKSFDQFDPANIARYSEQDIARLMSSKEIIRHRPKIDATINNARTFLKVQEEFGTFATYIWRFVDGEPIQNVWKTLGQIPKITKEAERVSRDLSKRGFRMVSPTICYTYMQSIGMVNDHMVDCFRYREVATTRES